MSKITNAQLEKLLKGSSLSINDFYLDSNNPFENFVEQGLFYYKLFSNDYAALKMELPHVVYLHKKHEDLLNKQDYTNLFSFIFHKAVLLQNFKYLFPVIPKEDRFNIFIKAHIKSEYGFEDITEDLLCKLIKEKPLTGIYSIPEIWLNESELIIYRGHTERSPNIKNSYVWTLKKSVAEWFSNRFDTNGVVYKAKISPRDVIAYIKDRNEHEIIVLPSKIYDIEDL